MIELRGVQNLLKYIQHSAQHQFPLYKNSYLVRQTSVSILLRFKQDFIKSHPLIQQSLCNLSTESKEVDQRYITKSEAVQKIVSNNTDVLINRIEDVIKNLDVSTIRQNAFEILYMKRSVRQNDLHSGQIAFPGGKVDEDENDLQAAIREVQEEIGYNLYSKQNYVYLGRLPLNVFAYFRKGQKVMLTMNIFLLSPDVEEEQLFLNPDEVSNTFWAPLSHFLYPLPGSVYYKELHRKPNNVLVLNKYLQKMIEFFAFKNYKYMKACHMKLNGEELFGLTFYITIYMLRIMYLQNQQAYEEYDQLSQMQEMIKLASIYTFHHKPNNFLQSFIINKLYYLQRLQQFDRI